MSACTRAGILKGKSSVMVGVSRLAEHTWSWSRDALLRHAPRRRPQVARSKGQGVPVVWSKARPVCVHVVVEVGVREEHPSSSKGQTTPASPFSARSPKARDHLDVSCQVLVLAGSDSLTLALLDPETKTQATPCSTALKRRLHSPRPRARLLQTRSRPHSSALLPLAPHHSEGSLTPPPKQATMQRSLWTLLALSSVLGATAFVLPAAGPREVRVCVEEMGKGRADGGRQDERRTSSRQNATTPPQERGPRHIALRINAANRQDAVPNACLCV